MNDFRTARLAVRQVDETADAEEYLSLFNSAPVLLRIIHPEMETDRWSLDEAEMYLWGNTVRENSVCMSARDEDGRLVGTAALLVPNPDDDEVWIGFLFVAEERPYGPWAAELLAGLEDQLAQAGWNSVLANAQLESELNQFWVANGFSMIDQRLNEDKLPVKVYRHEFDHRSSGR